MDRAVFDRMAELDQHHWWFTARRRILSSIIRRIVRPPANARILELGCGTGHNLDTLAKFGKVEAS
jgi:SAM-dependent methyltransferase